MENKNRVRITFWIDEADRDLLSRTAERDERSRSYLIRKLIQEHLTESQNEEQNRVLPENTSIPCNHELDEDRGGAGLESEFGSQGVEIIGGGGDHHEEKTRSA